MAKKMTYKDAGVDLDRYADAMARLPRLASRTFSPRVRRLEGGFAGLFRLDFAGPLFRRNYREPVLVSSTDGVGTKLKVAVAAGVHNTVGIDLVAMSVNDAICCGAEPLFFLDYVAMGKDDPALLEQIVSGISDACVESGCALLGGETAIMPDLYAPGDYDLAGFCVGVAEQSEIIDGAAIRPGDVILGVASSGLHSNGFSLVRKVVFEMAGLAVNDRIEAAGRLSKQGTGECAETQFTTVAEALLTPTKLYVRSVRDVLADHPANEAVRGIAHITGGGLHENLARILPKNVDAVIDREAWDVPAIFQWLAGLGRIDEAEMFRVFNMGVGLVLVVEPSSADAILARLASGGETAWRLGTVRAGCGRSVWA